MGPDGKASIREIQEASQSLALPIRRFKPRFIALRKKKAVRRIRKIGNADIFEPLVSRDVTRHRLLDEILSFFGGRPQPMMAQLVEAGKLTRKDVQELKDDREARSGNLRQEERDAMISDLTNHLWQSTLFVLVVWLTISALRENRAAVRYWLWFAASLKFLVPCSLLVGVGSHLRLTSDGIQPPLPVRAVSLAISQVAQPFLMLASPDPQQQTILDWTSVLFLAVWMCGFGIIMLKRLHCWRRIQRMVDLSRALTLGIAVPAISVRLASSCWNQVSSGSGILCCSSLPASRSVLPRPSWKPL